MSGFRTLWIALATVAAPIAAETYNNPTLGIAIEKPTDWHVLTAAQNAENLAKVDIGSPEFQIAVQRYATAPLYAFTKHREPYDDLNPSFKINTRPSGALVGRTGKQVREAIVPAIANAMPDFKLVTAPEESSLAGRATGHAVFDYTLKSGDHTYPARSELWIIPSESYLVLVGIGYRQDEKTGSREEVIKVVNSLKLND